MDFVRLELHRPPPPPPTHTHTPVVNGQYKDGLNANKTQMNNTPYYIVFQVLRYFFKRYSHQPPYLLFLLVLY